MNPLARRIRSTAPLGGRFLRCAVLPPDRFFGLVVFFSLASRAQLSPVVPLFTRSVSGQFVVTAPAIFLAV